MEKLLKIYNLGAYLTKTADEHLNEYIDGSDKRVEFLTNFTGSNGLAISCKRNVLYTDSRYYLQAEKELKNYELLKFEDKTVEDFLFETLDNKRVGLNPRHFSYNVYIKMAEKMKEKGIELVFIEEDLVDKLWLNKQERKFNEIYSIEDIKLSDYFPEQFDKDTMMLDKKYENVNVVNFLYEEKIKKIKDLIGENDEMIFTEMDTIAWIFNLRGSDICYNPLFYSYATISKECVKLFVNKKINIKGVEVFDYNDFENYCKTISKNVVVSGNCNAYIGSLFTSSEFSDNVRLLQSLKTNEELEGFNLSYILESACLCELFEYIEENITNDITESNVSSTLEDIRKRYLGYKGPSFESIVGFGKNSAVVHYSAKKDKIEANGALLIDCGASFIFGTTDTSRTFYYGTPSKEFKENYTRVLKGQLRAMMNKYPHKINGSKIDTLCRLDLWNIQEDFGHASGHGVGHFLCVHEHPPVISPVGNHEVVPCQIFSIEPGLYKEGEYGIRLENLVYTRDIGNSFQCLENLTYVPYQLNLIDVCMLNKEEISFVNNLSMRIKNLLTPLLNNNKGYDYMINNTKEIMNKN